MPPSEPITKTTVVLADDHLSIRQMLGGLLRIERCYEIVGEARTGFEALRLCRELKPRMAIIDLSLPELNGADLIRQIRKQASPDIRLMVYSGTLSRELMLEAMRAEPDGFVHKEDDLVVLREALRKLAAGEAFYTPFAETLRSRLQPQSREASVLTLRDRSIIQMVAEGLSSREIAERLEMTTKSVEHQRANLMDKLQLSDVASLTKFALRNGLLTLEP
jgi:DNA-binding NarL/FixJ family response regulator